MKHIVIGTAGHIDHGKTSLVRALTGIDTDRLKEEKERGITIELGFAHLDLEGERFGIVDVPGHERFVKNMLAGAAGIDLVMLIVAADEGVMPQTREHLAICRLLGVKAGLIALTKRDLVDPEWIELVEQDLREFVRGTFLEGQPVVPVSSATGEGLDELRAALREVAASAAEKSGQGLFRLPIDRVFTIRGFGVVVTGTLFSGTVRVGERVEVFPRGFEARVRGLEVHGAQVQEASAGLRTAVNLQGVERAQILRGDVLGRPGELKPTYMIDVHLQHLADAPRPLKTRGRVRFHAGTAEAMGRVALIGKDALEPGESGFAQLRLEEPVALLPRDRFVIRSYSPVVTIGGGEVLDVAPRKHRRLRASSQELLEGLRAGDESERLRILLAEAGAAGADVKGLTGRLTLTPQEIREGIRAQAKAGRLRIVEPESGLALTAEHFQGVQGAVEGFLAAYHKANPLRPGAPREEVRGKAGGATERVFDAALAALISGGKVKEENALLRLASHKVQLGEELGKLKEKIAGVFHAAGFQPPALEDAMAAAGAPAAAGRQALQVLVNEGTLVRMKDAVVYHRARLDEAQARLEERLREKGEITAAEFRDLLGITRKHAIPLLEYFDTARVTLRVGDKRVLRQR
ncbi:MAG: selenocysteine-specific translation elongation factor [Candidatus Tectomicrobia bacterium]|uniref:Selenocysteine-specific elongation factor n=1 Tax=Tectimicrobiota bacterium TaxID=2528274 RepID=A0A932HWR4_UNCTE|nr:selenocysteine-specific translation elongation factor [Candidatus Tectomicrobia bacterium]